MQKSYDLVEGSVSKKLWSLAWPMMLSVFFYTLYNLVDAYWVSEISDDAVAAVSISQIVLFVMMSLGFGVTVGSGVLMSMELGAKKIKKAEKVLGQSFVLMAILGVFFAGLSLLLKDYILAWSGATGEIFKPALEYFEITAAGSPLFFILVAIMFAFNSQGDTLTLTKLFACSTVINLILDPLLIFGVGDWEGFGIRGAALATLTSQFMFIVIAIRSLSSEKRNVRFSFRNLGLSLSSVKQVMKIGWPAALTQVLNPVGLVVLTAMASAGYGENGTIAFSLGFRMESFAYLPAVGYGFAAMAMIGQAIGSHNLKRAKEVLAVALKYAAMVALVLGLISVFFAEQIVRVFSDDAQVMEYSVQYFRTVSFSYLFLAVMMVVANAFQAIGRSWPGFWTMFVRFVVVAIPLSYLFTFELGWGIIGIWLSLTLANVVSAIVGYVWLRKTMNGFKFAEVDEAMNEV